MAGLAGVAESRKTLLDFIDRVHEDLQITVADYQLFTPEFLRPLEDHVQSAWDDLQADFETARRRIRAVSEALLRAHGPTGPQLTLKIENSMTWRKVATDQWNRFKEMGRRISPSTVLLLLKPAETIMESLSFIPGVGPIAEFKSVMESVAEGSKESEGELAGIH